jgi:hypothetical protein
METLQEIFFRKGNQMSTKTRGQHHRGHASNAEVRDEPAQKPVVASQKVGKEDRSQLIRDRAHALWEQSGKPDGDAAREGFWYEAEKEIMGSHAKDQ